jgi:hypothetical protein
MRAIVSVFVLVVFSGSVQAQPGAVPPAGPAGPTVAPDPGPPPMGPPAEPYPGQMQPYPEPYPGQPPYPYPPAYPGQPPYPYPPVQLTPEEHQLLAEGEISLGQHAGGVVANWLFGFGIGQAIQGRWSDTGWIFTLGEAAGITLIVAGALRTCFLCGSDEGDDGVALLIGGVIGYAAFHIWSIVDAAAGPAGHNRKVRELRSRVGLPMHASQRILPYAARARDGGGTVGLTLRF